jgi:excisionase family DNA binding protein
MKDFKEFPEIMTPEELAEYLRVSRQTIYNLLWRGELPGMKVGTHWRLKKSDVEKWILQKGRERIKKRENK